MKKILIRDAVLQDLPTLLKFEQALIEAERPFDSTIKPGPVHYYDLKELILNPEVKVVVAVADKTVVSSGYCHAKPARHYLDHETYAYMGFMYTHPDFRGQGINRRIVDELKDWAIAQGLLEVRLTVYPENAPAVKAYEKVGFDPHLLEMRLRIKRHDS